MNFLHLSTGDHRGAYSAAYALHRNLLRAGHQSWMIVGEKKTSDTSVEVVGPGWQMLRKLAAKAINYALNLFLGRAVRNQYSFSANAGLVPTSRVLQRLPAEKPDLIIAYNVADFLSLRQLAEIRAFTGVPVALYLMDMGHLTAACQYSWGCTGYSASCVACPAANAGLVKHWVRGRGVSRARHLKQLAPIVIAGSGWLQRQVEDSRFLQDFPRHKVLIGVDSDAYRPREKARLRQQFGLQPDRLVIYFGAQNLDDPRKGFSFLKSALQHLHSNLDPNLRARVCLFTIGVADSRQLSSPGFEHVHLGFIADPTLFSQTYAAADVFICPSVEDSGPMMINEAMMSGTPVVSFEMGVAVDLIVNGETGYRVSMGDSKAMAKAIELCIGSSAEEREQMSKACRTHAMQLCAVERQVESFVHIAETAGE